MGKGGLLTVDCRNIILSCKIESWFFVPYDSDRGVVPRHDHAARMREMTIMHGRQSSIHSKVARRCVGVMWNLFSVNGERALKFVNESFLDTLPRRFVGSRQNKYIHITLRIEMVTNV